MIVRADFARNNALIGVWRQPRPDVQDWPLLVEIALGLGPKAAGTVFVLCSDLWTQTLTLPNVSTAGMSSGEIASALNFEAESLSGQSAFESMVALQRLPASYGYWIVQARRADFEQVSEVVARIRCRLGGIAHPGGLPGTLGHASKAWARIELWPDAVVMVRPDGDEQVVQVTNSDPQLGRWKPEWTTWSHGFPASEQEALVGPGITATPPTGASVVALDQEPELVRWLTAWAECLNRRTPAIPLLRPERKPLSTALCSVMACFLALVMILCCFIVHTLLDGSVQAANAELKHHQEHSKQMADLKKQADDLRTKQKELQAQADNLEKALKVVGIHRQRIAKFLTVLREVHPEDLYVEKIEAEAGDPVLRGRCLRPELADQFANQLALAIADHGWEVQSPKKEAMKIAANGGPWQFSIQIKNAKDMTLEKHVETKKGKAK